ncbi:MAG: hypothetical protein N2748_02805 [candidate division WOR-3 bacterium]|nr:hypothetical protein [candidate division WOR-3 bacterium]
MILKLKFLQGDTIKIIQGTQEVVAEVISGDRDALIEIIEEKPCVHYYIKDISEDTPKGVVSGVCILEIKGKIEQLEDGFTEITQEEIHARGYLTPTEAAAQAEQRDGGATDHETWYSWCDAYPYYGAKMVSAGSHTERATVGWVYTKGTIRGRNMQGFNYEDTKRNRNIFGWAATVSFQILYPGTTPPVIWTEYGHHEYPRGRIYYTQVSDTY